MEGCVGFKQCVVSAGPRLVTDANGRGGKQLQTIVKTNGLTERQLNLFEVTLDERAIFRMD
ncbi:hypothetical protein D3C73_1296510 [compost metagenome]